MFGNRDLNAIIQNRQFCDATPYYTDVQGSNDRLEDGLADIGKVKRLVHFRKF